MTRLVDVLKHAGFHAVKPKGSFFLYVKVPQAAAAESGKSLEFQNAEAVSQWLITEKFISTVPWDDAGAYLRFSVTFAAADEADEARVLKEIGTRLSGVRFQF
jgi:LL-diaminopimelate aminotransferase